MILKCEDVSIRYITGDFKDIGLKEWTTRHLTNNYHVTEFWADRHVSFEIDKGDMLGIIGSNGAGKSTLLKAVAGIMVPTEGSIKTEGRVSALLELASGFDGDLTVRENAYLRGAMLGYTREFMDEAYEQIIEFSELHDFQDRPFKQLSSGMKSRLAFSIASLVEPEILILDEVLSVGDGAFRTKSERKMKEIIGGGAATVLVSHSIRQVRSMCNKVLWLHKGEQIAFGDNVAAICDAYEDMLNKKGPVAAPENCWLTEEEKAELAEKAAEAAAEEEAKRAAEEMAKKEAEVRLAAEEIARKQAAAEEKESPAAETDALSAAASAAKAGDTKSAEPDGADAAPAEVGAASGPEPQTTGKKEKKKGSVLRWVCAGVAFIVLMTVLSHLRAEDIDRLKGSNYSPEAFAQYAPGSCLYEGDPSIYYVEENSTLYYVLPTGESTEYRFSLHVYPRGYSVAAAKAETEEDIPEKNQMQNLDFNFFEKEVYLGFKRKVAAVKMPNNVEPERIVTGQFYQNADGSYTGVWEEELWIGIEITEQPKDVTAEEGSLASFTVAAEGEKLTYQWQWAEPGSRDWENSGADGNTTATLHVRATSGRDGMQYRCLVKSSDGTVVSDTAVLTVK